MNAFSDNGRGRRLGFRANEALSASAREVCVNYAGAAAPDVDLNWIPALGSEAPRLAAAAPGSFDMAAIRPRRELAKPASRAWARADGPWGVVISTGLHGIALAALLTWATPMAEQPPPEAVTIEIVADAPPSAVHETEPPSAPAPTTPPPGGEATPPVAPPPIEGPMPPAPEPTPPPVAETAPPAPEPTPPPVAETAPPAPGATPPPAAETAPPAPKPTPPPVVETPPRVPEPTPPPAAETPPPAPKQTPPPPVAEPPPRPAPRASPTPRPVQAPPPPKARPEPRPEPRRRTSPKSATEESKPTTSTSAPATAAAPRVSSEDAEAYRGVVFGRIAAQKRYPEAARERAPHGVAIVSFSIGGSGQVVGASLSQSAGDPTLDAEALATVRRASPFPPPPAGAPRNFSAPLSYRVR